MKIEKVYTDAYGTTWMYASFDRHPQRTQKRRTHHHRRKSHRIPLYRHIAYVASLAVALFIITGIVSASGTLLDRPMEDYPSTPLEEPIKRDVAVAINYIEEIKLPEITEMIQDIQDEPEIIIDEPEEIVEEDPTIEECIGQASFTIGTSSFTSLELPDTYYPGIDFSSFQPYEDYGCITNTRSAAYSITRSDRAYNDANGLRRYSLTDEQFSINGEDDYVIALGTFYKPKGTCGQRYLIVTTTGYYTAIAGDEKSDLHTDDMHMFTLHCNGEVAGIIEWLVDTDTLNTSMKRSGNIATKKGPVEELKGDILYIYLIEE